ncbi:unnamed protein product [Prunus armeniaca]|uniref:Uncharacterized protein n=1 Tax=Prunus armeniaca TaxID=36596 RepID=A0A6J5TXM1_PRUAR|nr:unnamed protein product [Prunus armeniaca]
MKQAAIHAKAEHFNSKGMPSASPGSTTSTGQPSTSTYDRFPPHQTTSQAPYRTTPTVPGQAKGLVLGSAGRRQTH